METHGDKGCGGLTRRNLIRVGGLTALGFGLGDFFRLQNVGAASPDARTAKAKSCIVIWLNGGPSHLETFDTKPNAPSEVRGPFGTVASNVAGVQLSEYLELTAKTMDKLAIVRSMTSPLGEHSFATQYMMTGYKPSPALTYPMWASTLSHFRPRTGVLPSNIAVPDLSGVMGGSVGNGFLPTATAPFEVGGDPAKPDFKIRDLDLYKGLDLERLDRRRQIVNAFDEYSRSQDADAKAAVDTDLERAYRLLSSETARGAFDLTKEPDSVRKRYGGLYYNAVGQGCLLARRLVERGVPFVTVNSNGWDAHSEIARLQTLGNGNGPLPILDRALSALIKDLSDRSLLDETLVVVMGEFGRTPRINAAGGRDHWPNAFSVLLAGGGIQGGQVVGSSDALGEYPKDNPITPSDLATTVFSLVGVDPAAELKTSDGRPIRVTPEGSRVIKELIA